jgi:hypothetical protein
MKQLRLFGLALMIACAVGAAMVSSAFALPDISVELGGTYPLHLEVTLLTIITKLSNVVKENINGEGLLILDLLTALGHLGTYEALVTKMGKGPSNVSVKKVAKKILLEKS